VGKEQEREYRFSKYAKKVSEYSKKVPKNAKIAVWEDFFCIFKE